MIDTRRRLLVYFFWDQDGIVDDYVLHTLRALRPFCSTILVVANGFLTDGGRAALESVSDDLFIRKNIGLDAWAYREALEHFGFERLAEFDDVIVTNFTVFGPVFPLSELFGRMDASPADFWGLVKYLDANRVMHLQSYFVCYRKSLATSAAFLDYWHSLPEIKTYVDSVNLHELRQTPFFAERGFTFDSFVPIEKYAHTSPYNFIITCAERILVEDRCPFIKRRVFFYNEGNFEYGVTQYKIRHITDFIKGYTDYDIEMMHQNLARTQRPKLETISRYRLMKRRLGSVIHPNPQVRAHLKHVLSGADDKMRDRYLDWFHRVRINPDRLTMWSPSYQHVGRQTYAMPDIFVQNVFTVIGSFCSIGSRVVLGHGEHPLDFLSSSPYFYFDELGYKDRDMPAYDKYWFIEPIRIGNDVWIGDGVFVKNGVTIGDGAMIGARAVVTKDVPPYAIVAGVPAKVQRYRFDPDIVAELLALKWWDLPDDVIKRIPFYDIKEALAFLRTARACEH